MKKLISLAAVFLMCVSFAKAQTAEVTVTLNEQFFDSLLDAIFKNFNAPEFPLAQTNPKPQTQITNTPIYGFKGNKAPIENRKSKIENCTESIRLLREIDGVKTAVRFRDGRINAPIAFSGSYNPPLVGCVDFQGYAETTINLEYDKQSGKLLGRVHVESVNLGGVANMASGVLSRLVQSSIDKKINPVEILQIEKLSFLVPVSNTSLKMKATNVRTEIGSAVLNVVVAYEFSKGN